MDMHKYEKYYYYNKEIDDVVECTWDEYISVPQNLKSKIKYDAFTLGSKSPDVNNTYGLKDYEVSTICLMKDHNLDECKSSINPLIYETMIFSDDNDLDGYCVRHSCRKIAKSLHDDLVLKIIRGEEINA
jgi:3-methyladenine DNA glycosylase AlkC